MKILWDILKSYLPMGIISIIIGIILKYEIISINSLLLHTTQYATLFSTISTILSTIFALIFVVLTISIQLSNKYTSFDLFLNTETKILMCIYFFTIISSLFMMQLGYYFPVFTLTLTTFCILSLYPFLHNVNSKILYDIGIKNLGEEISEFVDSKKAASAKHRIEQLGYLGKKSMTEKSSSIIDNIIDIYMINLEVAGDNKLYTVVETIGTQLIKIADNISKKDDTVIVEKILESIRHYMILYATNIRRPDLIDQQLMIKNIGIKFIENNFDEKYIISIEKTLFLSLEETYIEIWDYDDNAIVYLRQLAEKSVTKSLRNSIVGAVTSLWLIGIIIYSRKSGIIEKMTSASNFKKLEQEDRKIHNCLSTVIEQLNIIEINIGIDEFNKIFEESKKSDIYTWMQNPNMIENLNVFNEYYSKCEN